MTLKWVVLRPLKNAPNYLKNSMLNLAPSVCVVGTVEAEDRAQAEAVAAETFGPNLEVTSKLSFDQYRAEETRLERRNRTKIVDLTFATPRRA